MTDEERIQMLAKMRKVLWDCRMRMAFTLDSLTGFYPNGGEVKHFLWPLTKRRGK